MPEREQAQEPASPGGRRRLPPQATMGLLDYLSSHAVDEDYAFVSSRRALREDPDGGGAGGRHRARLGPLGAVAVVAFAALLVVAGLQTSRNAGSEAADRRQLVRQVADARAQLADDRTRLADLQQAIRRDQQDELSNDASTAGLRERISRLQTLTGTVSVRGPGVRVVADDAPGATSSRNQVLDTDLQKLVNGFWEAGAEAIALDGQRLTTLTTIRLAGGAITVNAHSLRRPYVVTVIGDRDTLPARFAETTSGQAWLDLQQQVGLRLSITPEDELTLPGLAVSLRYARQAGPRGSSSPTASPAASPTASPSSSPSSSPGGTP